MIGDQGVGDVKHRIFKEFRVGSERIVNADLIVMELKPSAMMRYDAILGLDFISTHRLWLSYDTHRLFFSRMEMPATTEKLAN